MVLSTILFSINGRKSDHSQVPIACLNMLQSSPCSQSWPQVVICHNWPLKIPYFVLDCLFIGMLTVSIACEPYQSSDSPGFWRTTPTVDDTISSNREINVHRWIPTKKQMAIVWLELMGLVDWPFTFDYRSYLTWLSVLTLKLQVSIEF